MIIKKLWVYNFRCFEDFEITFDENLTVIVAENGMGKTAVLDAVSIALGPFIGGFDTGVNKGFANDDARLVIKNNKGSAYMMESLFPVRLEAEGVVDNHPIQWARALSGMKSRTTIREATALQTYAKKLQRMVREEHLSSEVVLPIVSYYGTGRLWDQKQLPHTESKLSRSRLSGYSNALDPKSTYKHFAQWFRDESRAKYDRMIKLIESGTVDSSEIQTVTNKSLESINEAINICLKVNGWKNLRYDFEFRELTADHPKFGTIPVSRLSDGVRNMIGLVADIAYRCTKLNPHLENAPKETYGIVLIDEVDMHLHPKWQQVVLQTLLEAFPKVQFIVTTHSPQVLSTIDRSNIRLIQTDSEAEAMHESRFVSVEPEFQTKGVASYEALARIMGIDPVPDVEEAKWLNTYKEAIEMGTADEMRNLWGKIIHHFGDTHPEVLECRRLLRLHEMKKKLFDKKEDA
jgi:predicted ATP-binding protein involved in virulence